MPELGGGKIEETLGKVAVEVAKDVYQDGAKKGMTQVGGMLEDVLKTLRLFTMPIRYAALLHDRLTKHLDEVRARVQEQNQQPAMESFSMPLIENLQYIDEDHYLKEYYLNLLAKGIDKTKIDKAHPAFATILHQLSYDEIMVLEQLRTAPMFIEISYFNTNTNNEQKDKTIKTLNVDESKLLFPQHRTMYVEHLQSLDLLRITEHKKQVLDTVTGRIHKTLKEELSKFGILFLEACSR